ncbi:Organic cation transporter-like protein [Holothuria leucospilota]|uniref:Organic cation transporter-like protein n=1 Tax=Holothuria leucospilota TaxID=206669 RepID=A0A9Q1H1H8_HOLLE|nr:Organic cation transporter-like protein [Holothuria leucospilota]
MESSIQSRTIDGALKLVGDFGRLHIGLLLINVVFQFIVPWMTQVLTFTGATSEHYCKTKEGFNRSSSIPIVGGIHNREDVVYSSCERYTDPYYKNDTEACLDGWVYSDDVYGETLVTEWDLVCSREGLTDISQSLMMLGGAVGSVVAGTLAGHIGRRPVIIGSLIIYVICGCSLIFSPNFAVFTLLFTLYGATEPGFWSICHILLMEYLLPDRRALISSWPPLFQSFGAVALSFLAFHIRDWRYLQVALMIPPVLMLSVIWLIPESVRWHVSRNDLVKAEKILQRIASINKKDTSNQILKQTSIDRVADTSAPDDSYTNAAFFIEDKVSEIHTVSAEVSEKRKDKTEEEGKPTFVDLLRPPVLFITLAVCFIRTTYSLVYFGFVLNTGNLAGDPYLNFLIGALLEIPGRLFPIALVKR